MKNCNTREHQTTRRLLRIAGAAALAAAFTVSLPQPAHAHFAGDLLDGEAFLQT